MIKIKHQDKTVDLIIRNHYASDLIEHGKNIATIIAIGVLFLMVLTLIARSI